MTAAEYRDEFDRAWAAVIEPLIDLMEAEARERQAADGDAEECIDLEEEMRLLKERRQAG
jgi:hypothetical protein